VIQHSLQELYSSKTDEELLALAADDTSLRDDAKPILAQELERRNLQRPKQGKADPERPLSTKSDLTRNAIFALALILNMCIALFVTAVLETGLGKTFQPHSLAAILWKWWILDFLCATGSGFSIYQIWKTNAAKWTWILPAIWFGLRFVSVAFSASNQSISGEPSLWSQFSGAECISASHGLGCWNFFLFTLPLVRGVSYSVGAYLSEQIRVNPRRSAEAVVKSGLTNAG
jgi:hypothetical protein